MEMTCTKYRKLNMCCSPVTLLGLPEAVLLLIAGGLTCEEVRSLQITCKYMFRSLASVWKHFLKRDFGLSVQAQADSAYRVLYQQCEAARLGSIRFRALYTDGGCDEGLKQYWADNCFQATHWESYCSAGERNVNIVGMHLSNTLSEDVRHAEFRDYIIQRLRGPMDQQGGTLPPAMLADDNSLEGRLAACSSAQLEELLRRFCHALFGPPVQNAMVNMLVSGLPNCNVEEELESLQEFYQSRLLVVAEGSRHLQQAEVHGHPSHANRLLDASAVPLLADAPVLNSAAVIEGFYISRHGNFSCPVRCGVVFLSSANVGYFGSATADDLMSTCEALADSPASAAFQDLDSREAVLSACASGALPPIVATGVQSSGIWIEFGDWPADKEAPNRRLQGRVARLRPLVWFMFFNKQERELVRMCLHSRGRVLCHPPDVPVVLENVPHSAHDLIRRESADGPSTGFFPPADAPDNLPARFVGSEAQFEQLRAVAAEMEARAAAPLLPQVLLGVHPPPNAQLQIVQDPWYIPLPNLAGGNPHVQLVANVGDAVAGAAHAAQGGPGPAAGGPADLGLLDPAGYVWGGAPAAQGVGVQGGYPGPVVPMDYSDSEMGEGDGEAWEDDGEVEEGEEVVWEVEEAGPNADGDNSQSDNSSQFEVEELEEDEYMFLDGEDMEGVAAMVELHNHPFQGHMVVRPRNAFLQRSKDRMDIPLRQMRGGNVLLAKLIDQENLMDAFEDHHEGPNIDVNQIVPYGKCLRLPQGVSLVV